MDEDSFICCLLRLAQRYEKNWSPKYWRMVRKSAVGCVLGSIDLEE